MELCKECNKRVDYDYDYVKATRKDTYCSNCVDKIIKLYNLCTYYAEDDEIEPCKLCKGTEKCYFHFRQIK